MSEREYTNPDSEQGVRLEWAYSPGIQISETEVLGSSTDFVLVRTKRGLYTRFSTETDREKGRASRNNACFSTHRMCAS